MQFLTWMEINALGAFSLQFSAQPNQTCVKLVENKSEIKPTKKLVSLLTFNVFSFLSLRLDGHLKFRTPYFLPP